MRAVLAALERNVAAGVRLALFLPVRIADFRASLGAFLALLIFVYAFEIALEAVFAIPGARFDPRAIPDVTLITCLTLLGVAVVTVALGQPSLLLWLGVAVLAVMPPLTVVGHVTQELVQRNARPTQAWFWIAWTAWGALVVWNLAIYARVVALALAPRPRPFYPIVAGSATVLLAMTVGGSLYFQPKGWWSVPSDFEARVRSSTILSEQALVRQPQLLAEALADVGAHRPGVPDLFFVGAALYASQDVFERDLRTAQAIVEEAFDVQRRQVTLINNPKTVLQAPIATSSNLRAALKGVAERMDRDEDVVMVFLTTHGSADHRLAVEFFPLQLDPIVPAQLKAMLDEAGIRFRIVVISACYAGGFIPALADESTIVMTAAAADRTSFGCSHDSEMTFFTDALFNQALRSKLGLVDAFERARVLVHDRELAEDLTPPSMPQLHVGAEMLAKLNQIERRLPRVPCTSSC